MNSFILIDGVAFWIVTAITLLTLFAYLWKSVLTLKSDRQLKEENERLKKEIRVLQFNQLEAERKTPDE